MRRPALIIAAALAATVAGCGKPAEQGASQAPAPAVPEPTSAERQALLAALPAPYNAGDLENGKKKFALCRSCHTITPGGPNLTGPNLHGMFGRKAGAVANYKYSEAVTAAGFVWDAEKLDGWLADPRGFMPGTKMSFAGVKDPTDRRDLIAYLKVETGYKAGE